MTKKTKNYVPPAAAEAVDHTGSAATAAAESTGSAAGTTTAAAPAADSPKTAAIKAARLRTPKKEAEIPPLGYMPVPEDFKYMEVFLRGRPQHQQYDEFDRRHPVMDTGHRAKIFAPFDALKGFRECIMQTQDSEANAADTRSSPTAGIRNGFNDQC